MKKRITFKILTLNIMSCCRTTAIWVRTGFCKSTLTITMTVEISSHRLRGHNLKSIEINL